MNQTSMTQLCRGIPSLSPAAVAPPSTTIPRRRLEEGIARGRRLRAQAFQGAFHAAFRAAFNLLLGARLARVPRQLPERHQPC